MVEGLAEEESAVQPSLPSTSFPHVRQKHKWDCGLACLFMCLKAFGKDHDYASLLRQCATESVWTIDIATAARAIGGLGVQFYTRTLGTNPEYVKEKFYANHIEMDEQRVAHLFETAPSAGIELNQKTLPWQALASALASALWSSSQVAVLVLVDKQLLPPSFWSSSSAQDASGMGHYIGHYILLVSWDSSASCFAVHDPDSPSCPLFLTPTELDRARKAFGTDEDVCVLSYPPTNVLGQQQTPWNWRQEQQRQLENPPSFQQHSSAQPA